MSETSTAHFSASTAATLESQRQIRPLGDQIIIRVLSPDSVGSIIIPDSAKRISYGSASNVSRSAELQYVNRTLFEQMTESLRMLCAGFPIDDSDWEFLKDLHKRADKALLPKASNGIPQASGEALNFVEAEVIAVGPGKRGKQPGLLDALASALEFYTDPPHARTDLHDEVEFYRIKQTHERALIQRARRDILIPLQVKPGDHILYHPAVQSFDRKINPELIGLKPEEGDCYIIGEHSVLAVLDKED